MIKIPEKIIRVKATSKRKAHKRRIKITHDLDRNGDKEKVTKDIISLDYKESVKNMNDYIFKLNQTDEGKEIIKSISDYTMIEYIGINEYMKRGETTYFNSITENNVENTEKIIENIKKFIDNAPKFKGEVFRGVTYMMNSDKNIEKWNNFINNIKKSKTIEFNSFISCSESKKIANIFTDNYQKYAGDFNSCLITIKTKSGASIEKLSTSDEKEILLNFDKHYKILNFDESNPKKVHLSLEEI